MILGWMSKQDLKALKLIAQSVPENGTIVEVGSYMGKSAVTFAQNAPTSNIYCIDLFEEEKIVNHRYSDELCKEHDLPLNGTYNTYKLFKENTKDYSNIHMIRGYSPDEIQFDDFIDLFFLDASHKNPNDVENINYFLRFMKDKSVIAGHDYDPHRYPDVVENVHSLELLFDTEATYYPESSIWSIGVNSEN